MKFNNLTKNITPSCKHKKLKSGDYFSYKGFIYARLMSEDSFRLSDATFHYFDENADVTIVQILSIDYEEI